MVRLVSFYIDCTERSGGAEILALAAPDTFSVIHAECSLCHIDGLYRTMSCAETAGLVCSGQQAVLLYPLGVTDTDGGLLLFGDSFDCPRRAHFAAVCTLRTTVAALETHLGLHQSHRIGRWAQHVIRARTHA